MWAACLRGNSEFEVLCVDGLWFVLDVQQDIFVGCEYTPKSVAFQLNIKGLLTGGYSGITK